MEIARILVTLAIVAFIIYCQIRKRHNDPRL